MRSCSSLRLLRRGDRDQLDLGELVLADHAARVLAGRARFGAEARRAGGEPHRELVGFIDDGFADEIGQRDFGGGDEPAADPLRIRILLRNRRRMHSPITALFGNLASALLAQHRSIVSLID